MTVANQTNEKTAIAEKMLASIKSLQSNFSDRVEQTAQERKVPQASMDELQACGFFLALQP